nr:hemoglobin-binding protein [[Haemophilus] ducreyi]
MKANKLSAITLCILGYAHTVYAESNMQTEKLETIVVSSEDDSVHNKNVGEIKKNAKALSKQQVQDSRDLVRYETGVTVVEKGRFGSSGYAIRGVDENRVAVVVDGLHQAETISSQGFKELFEGYGNFNNTRNGVEVENLKQAVIQKGADAIRTGSGSLGGTVSFESKDARDYLIDKNYHFVYKTGYSSADNQKLHSVTAAGRYSDFDLLAVHTQRHGNELRNYGYRHYDGSVVRKEREKADPYKITKQSSLIKIGYQLNDTNRFTLGYDDSRNTSRGTDWSNAFTSYNGGPFLKDVRHTNDQSNRKNISFVYENFDTNDFWDTLKITHNHQKIKLKARLDEYCDVNGEIDCPAIANPSGLYINDKGIFLDKHDGEITHKKEGEFNNYFDSKGKEVRVKGFNVDSILINCDQYDCSKPMQLLSSTNNGYGGSPNKYIYKTYELFEKTMNNGNGKYAVLEIRSSGHEKFSRVYLPSEKGYVENQWKDRDLNTDTQQYNIDLTKSFKLKSVEHNATYGGLYSEVKKSMTNRAGYEAYNRQWWANIFFGKENNKPNKCQPYNGNSFTTLCSHEDRLFSFLIPVKTKTGALYVTDKIKLNDKVNLDVAYRYDRIKHDPKYIPGTTPKLPTDLILGRFIEFKPKNTYATQDEKNENAEKNAVYLASKKTKFSANSYSATFSFDPMDFLKIQAKYATGFRAPTSDEIYFVFQHPSFSIYPNLYLKAERSKNKEVAITLHKQKSFLTVNLFQTDYKDFLDLAYLKKGSLPYGNGGSQLETLLYQNVNRDKARVKGLEVNSKLHLGDVWRTLDGFNLSYKLSLQKGRMSSKVGEEGKQRDTNKLDTPMNAIQPQTHVVGVGYEHPQEKFGVDMYLTHASAKKEKDTFNMFYDGKDQKDQHIKWRSDRYTLVDLIAYVKPVKNVTLRAGVYNLTNREYGTWDSIRSIRPFGTTNLINQETGKGIKRFNAPGRNFRVNAEITF